MMELSTLVLLVAMFTTQGNGNGHGNHFGWFKRNRPAPQVEQVSNPSTGGSTGSVPSSDENVRFGIR
jgi:hypothetical protein